MNKILICLVLVCAFLLSACSYQNLYTFYINRVSEITLNVGETYEFDDYYVSSNEDIFSIEGNVGYANAIGDANITANNKDTPLFIIHVVLDAKYINVECDNILKVGESSKIDVVVSPISVSQEVEYEISDENIISIENGEIKALKEGYSDIIVKSKVNENIKTEISIIVQNSDETRYDDKINVEVIEDSSSSIDASNIGTAFNALIDSVKYSFVGIEKYESASKFNDSLKLSDFGGGVLYKRNATYNDGSLQEDVNSSTDYTNLKSFVYYVISTRNLVKDAKKLKIYLGEEYDTYDATLVSYDPKVDLSLLKFECPYYLPLIKLGNSDDIKQGEFVISINNSNGKEYFRTSTYGVISSTKRYVSVDTDDDQTSDWDSEFIQHDASINSESAKKVIYSSGDIYNYINGGALVNLKGELIGLDSMKISAVDSTINNMSLSIPTNLIVDIVNILITGKQPSRPLLGVTILDVTGYYKNKAYYTQLYGEMNIPDGLEFGFYISAITEGGVAYMANAQVGDILIKFNGIDTKYSYVIRAELGKFIIGSGDTAELVVIRNGEEVTLTVTF